MLPDSLREGLRIVFCGTAPSRRSAAVGAYYAHPGNQFWRALAACGLTPGIYAPRRFRELLDLGIGFTDLAKHHSGNDADLPPNAFDVAGLRCKLMGHAPATVAFTSKHAAQAVAGHAVAYGLQEWIIGRSAVFVLPSPSGQARRYWDLAPWHELARHVAACAAVDQAVVSPAASPRP